MLIGERLKALREQKNMSQGDIEKRTGLLRVYISRVENGHTVPAIETLEKFARLSIFRCMRSSMMARSRPKCTSRQQAWPWVGVVRGMTRRRSIDFAD